MSTTFTLAHLSDVHLSPIVGFTPRHWNAKRALGFINWQRKRRFVHRRSVADQIVADVKAQAPGHIAISGDLINIGLPAEYEAAALWLKSVGAGRDVSVVPGNHDIYTPIGSDPGVARWAAHMTSDDWGLAHGAASDRPFPYVRRLGPLALVGLNSAVETPPGIATGRVGADQLAAVARCLAQSAQAGLYRVVMIHHPPLPGLTRPHHELLDAAELAAVLASTGANLVLHGHTHLATVNTLAGLRGPIPIVGVGSASAARSRGTEPLAQYNLLRITGQPGSWQTTLTRRGLRVGSAHIVDLDTRVLP